MNNLKSRRLDNRASATLHRFVVSETINNNEKHLESFTSDKKTHILSDLETSALT